MLTRTDPSVLQSERLDLTDFFDGHIVASGVFEDRNGRVRRRFDAETRGHWQGETFILDEWFVFDDGHRESRRWRILPGRKAGCFSAQNVDCLAPAQGTAEPGVAELRYRMRLVMFGQRITFVFHDRFYLVDEGTVINRATLSKWGLRIGELTACFRRQDGAGDLNSS